MKKLLMFFKEKYTWLVNDKYLLMILILHMMLIICHVCHNFVSPIKYHSYLRAGGCGFIVLMIFFFGRTGLAYGFTAYACALIYVNNFYNYGTIFFILVAIGAAPPLKNKILILYLINVIISFSIKHLMAFSVAIHIVYIILFYILTTYIFRVNPPEKLKLTDDEIVILEALSNGYKQKEIEGFSQPTITMKLKNARDRNLCSNTGELLSRYNTEKKQK